MSILIDHYYGLSLMKFLAFLWHASFKNEKILIYCKCLQGSDALDDNGRCYPTAKGNLTGLKSYRAQLTHPSWELQCDRYDGVKDFFTYEENGTIGHISWLYYSKDPNRILQLGEDECEIKFCLTRQQFRGRGLYPAALQAAQRYLKDKGYKRCFICAREDNIPSIRGIAKAGFLRVGEVRFQKLFGFQITAKRDTRYLE
jgi:RimJ/RimL family protein N-acetyltransferase